MSGRATVNVLSQAEEDIQEIIEFIFEDRPSAADTMFEKLQLAFSQLSKNPSIGRKARDKRLSLLGYRYLVVGNYLIFYRIKSKVVYVYRVLHGARNYAEIL
jgi:toxin ParE1/3/4